MNELQSKDTPQERLRFVTVAGSIFIVSLIVWWVWNTYYKEAPQSRQLELSYRATAEVTEYFGFFDGDGYRTIVVRRDGKQSPLLKFPGDEWPLACRFFAEDTISKELTIIQLNPIVLAADPGVWLNAKTLEKLPLERLPATLKLIDDDVIE